MGDFPIVKLPDAAKHRLHPRRLLPGQHKLSEGARVDIGTPLHMRGERFTLLEGAPEILDIVEKNRAAAGQGAKSGGSENIYSTTEHRFGGRRISSQSGCQQCGTEDGNFVQQCEQEDCVSKIALNE